MTCGTASSYSLPSCPKDSNHLSRWGGLSASQQSCHSDARNATKGDTSTMDLEITLRVNGATYQLSVDTRTTLLDALRERLRLTGPTKGCDPGQCGGCTLLPDGRRDTSCLPLAVAHQEAQIVTIEGLAADGDHLHPLQQSFIEHDAFQCGYCIPGQLCSAVGMLREAEAGWSSAVSNDLTASHIALDDDEIRERMSGNLCCCAAYANIVPAIREAVQQPEQVVVNSSISISGGSRNHLSRFDCHLFR